jgi:cytochrome c peroxidase
MLLLLAAAIAIPLGLDLYLPAPEDNPLTPEKIAFGRELFFDKRLSRDGSVSCASCHDPERAFSDSRAVAAGVFGREGRRNAPALINRGLIVATAGCSSGTAASQRSKSKCSNPFRTRMRWT